MEVKINKEIRAYTESMFFGLSLRQCVFSLLGCATAVVIYFLFRDKLPLELVSWACVLGVAPFAALGFLKYNGMAAEKFIWVWIKFQFLCPKEYSFKPVNLYQELLKEAGRERRKRRKRKHDKDFKHVI